MNQGSLFDLITHGSGAVGLAGVMPEIRAAMNRVAGEYPPGRKKLVDDLIATAKREGMALTAGGGKVIKEDQLDKILQHKDGAHEPTFGFMLCFCLATKDFSPLEPIWRVFRLTLVSERDLDLLEYGKWCDTLRKAKSTVKKLEARL